MILPCWFLCARWFHCWHLHQRPLVYLLLLLIHEVFVRRLVGFLWNITQQLSFLILTIHIIRSNNTRILIIIKPWIGQSVFIILTVESLISHAALIARAVELMVCLSSFVVEVCRRIDIVHVYDLIQCWHGILRIQHIRGIYSTHRHHVLSDQIAWLKLLIVEIVHALVVLAYFLDCIVVSNIVISWIYLYVIIQFTFWNEFIIMHLVLRFSRSYLIFNNGLLFLLAQ